MDTVTATGLRADRRTDSPFTSSMTPSLSWRADTPAAGWRQARAELELTSDAGTETASVDGDASVQVPWPFGPIAPRARVAVRVRVHGVDGSASDWSAPLDLVGGTLADGEWVAAFIGLDDPEPKKPAELRGSVTVRDGLRSATLYTTAHGAAQVRIDGAAVDDLLLKPGWTSYPWRLLFEAQDVTALLSPGDAEIRIELAGAWWTESFGWTGQDAGFYGDRPAAALQLVLEYADGTTETVATDASWEAAGDGSRTASGIYHGESADLRRTASEWRPVRVDESDLVPVPRSGPPVRVTEALAVREVITTPAGKTVLDFGQNLVGRLRIRVAGPAGTEITLRHAEVLEHGELGVRPLRAARATDHVTLAGTGSTEEWAPEFTFHGFRYAEVSGWPGELDPAAITAEVMGSDMERTGWFASSDPLLDRLHENVVWGMRGNFLSIPTDCPQRDERLGWTGDIQVFSPTATFLFDCDGFLASWLEDVALEQASDGGIVPFVVPNVIDRGIPAAAWGDATCVVPTVLHERFGDVEALRRQLPWMEAWTSVLVERAGDRMLWEDSFQFGDWLDPDASPHFPADAKTDADIVASGYLYRSADLTARAAATLGETAIAERWSDVARRVKAAFLREYASEAGRMLSDAQTGYAMAIRFGLFRDDAQRQAMGDRLAALVRAAGYRIGTGFVGTPVIADALTVTGHAAEAGRLLTQTENPSWLYPVTMGATTVWERWDSMLEDGTINPGEMTSFNHYALGAVADWMHRSLAGLAPAAPGYRVISIAPTPIAGLDSASAEHVTPYGRARVEWRIADGRMTVSAVVPPNSSAVVTLPGQEPVEVAAGAHEWTIDAPDLGAVPPAPTLQSSLADVIDDREAYELVRDTVLELAPDAAAHWKHVKWTPGRPFREALPMHRHSDVVVKVEALLGDLAERRGK